MPNPSASRPPRGARRWLWGLVFVLVALVGYGAIITKVGLFGSADFVPSAQRAAPSQAAPSQAAPSQAAPSQPVKAAQ